MGGTAETEVARGVDGARVVDTGSDVVLAGVAAAGLLENLLEAVALGGAVGAILDHLGDGGGRARGLDAAEGSIVASASAVVVLHQSRVADAAVGSRGAHAAAALLHHNSEDEARVDAGRGADAGDGALEIIDLVGRVVRHAKGGAGAGQDVIVGSEPRGKVRSVRKRGEQARSQCIERRNPLIHGGPALADGTGAGEDIDIRRGVASFQRVCGGSDGGSLKEGEAASSEKLEGEGRSAVDNTREVMATYNVKSEHDGKGRPSRERVVRGKGKEKGDERVCVFGIEGKGRSGKGSRGGILYLKQDFGLLGRVCLGDRQGRGEAGEDQSLPRGKEEEKTRIAPWTGRRGEVPSEWKSGGK